MPELGLEAVGAARGIADTAHVFAASDRVPHSATSEQIREIDEVALARASEYRLLASLLAQAPSQEILASVSNISGNATKLGQAHAALAEAAAKTDADAVTREYFDLFIGVGRG